MRAEGGGGLTLSGSGWVEISADGTVLQDNNVAGRLEIRDFPGAGSLVKRGSNYFRPADSTVQPTTAPGASVVQGQVEASNAGSAESAVRLINVMRQFEMLQKAVSLGLEMNQRAIQDVAKVGS